MPIKEISQGDLIYTRKKLKPVLWSGLTKRKAQVYDIILDDGNAITATSGHPIYTKELGFVTTDTLKYIYKHKLPKYNSWHPKRKLSLTALNLEDTAIKGISSRTADIAKRESIISRYMSGRNIWVKYQKDNIYTTKMGINPTMTYPILKCYPQKSISEKYTKGKLHQKYYPIYRKFSPSQKIGINQQKAKNGIVSNGIEAWKMLLSQSKNSVRAVQMNSLTDHQNIMGDSAQIIANQECSGSEIQNITKISKKEKVYNLHIKDQHEFFANKILVHNCMDAIRYALMTRDIGFTRISMLPDPDNILGFGTNMAEY